MALHHVNFHTIHSIPVFADDRYDATMRACLPTILRRHRVFCPVWEVMPTHVHLLVEDFPIFSRGDIVGRVKGATAYAFFQEHPSLREDLLGGHLWSKGYFAVLIIYGQVGANSHQALKPQAVPLHIARRSLLQDEEQSDRRDRSRDVVTTKLFNCCLTGRAAIPWYTGDMVKVRVEEYGGHMIIYEQGPTSWSAYVEDVPVCFAAGATYEECAGLIKEGLVVHLTGLLAEATQSRGTATAQSKT